MSHVDPVRLADYAAGRMAPARRERIAQHLEDCQTCRQVLSRVGGARTALKTAAEQVSFPVVAAGAARIEATLRWTWSGKERWGRRSWRWPALFALGTVAAAAMGLFVLRPRSHADASVQAQRVLPPKTLPSATVALEAVTAAPPHRPLQALMTLVAGESVLHHEDRALDPSKVATLVARDRLVTWPGGRVGFQWGEGSGALLESDSMLDLTRLELRAQELALAHGRVAVRVGPHQPGESLHVVTPYHQVSVHGTWFVVSASTSGTTVAVLEGVVAVSLPGQPDGTRISAPMRMFFPPGQAVGERVETLSAREAAALRATSESGMMTWNGGVDPAKALAGLLAATSPLHIQPEPVAQVAVDGVSFGQAPLWLRRPHGRHLVELTRPGFSTVSRWVSLALEPGELRTTLPEIQQSRLPAPSSPEEVQEVAQRRHRQISACYTHALKRDPGLEGTVMLRIRVGGAGEVLATAVEDDTLTDPLVAECLRREAAGWKFARARNVTVVYPFVFRTPA